MPTVTSRRAGPSPKVLKERRALCEELVEIERRTAPEVARTEAIMARLKVMATEDASFKEVFADGSYVTASGAVAAEFKGDAPVIVTEAWQALSPASRHRFIDRGLIKIEPQWGRATSGRVQVKIFGEAA